MVKKEKEVNKKIKKDREPEAQAYIHTLDHSILHNGRVEEVEHDMREGLEVSSFFNLPTKGEQEMIDNTSDKVKKMLDKMNEALAAAKAGQGPSNIPQPMPSQCQGCEDHVDKVPEDQVKKYVADRKSKERGVVV